jgi:predicted AlkP superfamily pyrophosphatase or phosphodiesterase
MSPRWGHSRRTAFGLGLLTAALAACARPVVEPPSSARATAGRLTDHVVVISVDGLRPDAIERFGAATLQRLMREGAYAPDAQTILPSSTLPSHTSMLTGVEPTVHGILWNSYRVAERGYVAVPTVFGLARGAGFRTAAFFEKSKLHHIHPPGTIDHVGSFDKRLPWRRSGHRTARAVGEYLATNRPNLVFIHLADVDFAGHLFGWMGRLYGRTVRDVDSAVATLIAHADMHLGRGRYTVIVTADHGGHGRRHGTERPDDTTIPWIIWGRGVRPGTRLSSGVRTTDTAATVLWLLGVAVPETWSGRPVMQALDTTSAAIPVAH